MTKAQYPDPKGWLDIQICKSIYKAFKDNAAAFGLDAPAATFDSRHNGILESICGSVQLKASLTNQDIIEVSVCYFVKLARSQAFFDGNKRMSVVLTNVFLLVNGYGLFISPTALRDLAIAIAENKITRDDKVIRMLVPKFKKMVRKLD